MAPKKDKELVTVKTSELAFDNETVELIKKTVAVDATDTELKLFLYQAKKSGLDPLARQIYFIKRQVKTKKWIDGVQRDIWEGKVTIQSSIDGFRVVAERNGDYAGQDEPEFVENTQLAGQPPLIAKVRVYKFRGDTRYIAATGVAYWSEYVPNEKNDFMWRKMPHTMLAKVAEALALRKAFPQDLSGLYTAEEMEQAVIPVVEEAPKVIPAKAKEVKKSEPVTTGPVTAEDVGEIVEDPTAEWGNPYPSGEPSSEPDVHQAASDAVKNDNPEEHVCTLHQYQGKPVKLKDRGKGIWDHRSKGFLKEDGTLEYSQQGDWHHCQGQGWHLSTIQ